MRSAEDAKKPISFNINHTVEGKKYTFEIYVEYKHYTDNAAPATGTWFFIKYKGVQLRSFSLPLWDALSGFATKDHITKGAKHNIDLKASLIESQIKKIDASEQITNSLTKRKSKKPSRRDPSLVYCSNCGDAMYQAGHKEWHCDTCGETEYTG
jgi:hypothetical protein